jgi:hypothetical protein
MGVLYFVTRKQTRIIFRYGVLWGGADGIPVALALAGDRSSLAMTGALNRGGRKAFCGHQGCTTGEGTSRAPRA